MPVTDKNFNSVVTGTGYAAKADQVGASQIVSLGPTPNQGLQLVTDIGGVTYFCPLAPNSVGQPASGVVDGNGDPADVFVFSTMNGTAFG